ncbi:MAG: hypothetical protein IH608_08785 [Proteobacteria bacterium]|nr:hypothetical protein [Pseudomonadota bacterium]
MRELELGKGITTCKECLPLLLTVGSLLRYLEGRRDPEEVVVYFMPQADGPCRFGQYSVFLENYFRKQRLGNVALLSLSAENGYGGMSTTFTRRGVQALAIGDGLDDIYAALLVLAAEPEAALEAFSRAREKILSSLARDDFTGLLAVLRGEMRELAALPLRGALSEATTVTLAGEIFVRRDGFSRQNLVEHLARQGVVVRTVPITEWLHYTDYCVLQGLSTDSTLGSRLSTRLKRAVQCRDEALLHHALALSGLFPAHATSIRKVMEQGARLLAPEIAIESSLTIGTALTASPEETHGVISIGPFGCMPGRISEAILHHRLERERDSRPRRRGSLGRGAVAGPPLPFLAIETDGTPLSPLMEARLEGFVLAAHRFRLAGHRRGVGVLELYPEARLATEAGC